MSKDLKDLIDSVEQEAQTKAELEKALQSMEEEKNKLEFRVQEQKILIENLQSQIKEEDLDQSNLPSELDVLKELIMSQRKELDEKDKILDNLKDKQYEISSEVDDAENSNSIELLNEEYINSQRLIVELTDENEELKEQIKSLQTQLDKIQIEQIEIDEEIEVEALIKENEELINIKRLNFQLMEENGLLRLQVEKLKTKIQEKLNGALSEELLEVKEKNAFLTSEIASLKNKFQEYVDLSIEESELAKEKIAILTLELEETKEKLKESLESYENLVEPAIINPEDALEFTKMREKLDETKEKLKKSQIDNQALNAIIDNLKQQLSTNQIEQVQTIQNGPKKLSISLFYRIFKLLDNNKKLKVINSLIEDLQSKNNEIKRNAIRILSVIKHNSVYSAFIEMLNDQDWLVRYSIIKALSKFETKNEELQPILKKFTKDNDVDVRELAVRILNEKY
ncbi:MAG: HEAT repeat domain-containing protein [Promethearchaeota archaeon]